MPSPSLFDFLRDAESWRGMRQGLTDAANRGMVAGTLGAPVDMATQAANLGIAGVGYLGHKTGLLSAPPELLDSRNVPGSSEWIGQKMQNAGAVSANRNPVAEMGMGLLSPFAFKAAQKAGELLAGVEMKAAENAAKPSTLRQVGQRGAIVWHGSPHKFDKFDSSKIGTGEGAQAYGHGLYLAESPGVARDYAGALSAAKATKPVGNVDLTQAYQNLPNDVPETLLAARRDFRELTDAGELSTADRRDFLTAVKNNLAASKNGQLYKVDLPDDAIAKMLNWDKPMSEQPQEIQSIAKSLLGKNNNPMAWLVNDGAAQDMTMTGKQFLNTLIGGESQLQKAGIPGIRYLDGGSRGTGAGTSNFVVFPGNESLLSILERNGQPIR
jgi:hypothetical protein